MVWQPYEKDGAIGTLSGTLHGDTVVADYDYMIEGSQQQEEKFMLLKGDSLQVLSAPLKEVTGKVIRLVVKDKKLLKVSSTLHKAECGQLQLP